MAAKKKNGNNLSGLFGSKPKTEGGGTEGYKGNTEISNPTTTGEPTWSIDGVKQEGMKAKAEPKELRKKRKKKGGRRNL